MDRFDVEFHSQVPSPAEGAHRNFRFGSEMASNVRRPLNAGLSNAFAYVLGAVRSCPNAAGVVAFELGVDEAEHFGRRQLFQVPDIEVGAIASCTHRVIEDQVQVVDAARLGLDSFRGQ
jgi:hypothetical protein